MIKTPNHKYINIQHAHWLDGLFELKTSQTFIVYISQPTIPLNKFILLLVSSSTEENKVIEIPFDKVNEIHSIFLLSLSLFATFHFSTQLFIQFSTRFIRKGMKSAHIRMFYIPWLRLAWHHACIFRFPFFEKESRKEGNGKMITGKRLRWRQIMISFPFLFLTTSWYTTHDM